MARAGDLPCCHAGGLPGCAQGLWGVFQENPGVWLPSGMPEAAVVALNLHASQDESRDTVYLDALSSDEQVSPPQHITQQR